MLIPCPLYLGFSLAFHLAIDTGYLGDWSDSLSWPITDMTVEKYHYYSMQLMSIYRNRMVVDILFLGFCMEGGEHAGI